MIIDIDITMESISIYLRRCIDICMKVLIAISIWRYRYGDTDVEISISISIWRYRRKQARQRQLHSIEIYVDNDWRGSKFQVTVVYSMLIRINIWYRHWSISIWKHHRWQGGRIHSIGRFYIDNDMDVDISLMTRKFVFIGRISYFQIDFCFSYMVIFIIFLVHFVA